MTSQVQAPYASNYNLGNLASATQDCSQNEPESTLRINRLFKNLIEQRPKPTQPHYSDYNNGC